MAKEMIFGYNFGKLSVAIVPAGTRAEKGDWVQLDPKGLSRPMQLAYVDYVAARAMAKQAKDKFEELVREQAGLGKPSVTAKPQAKAMSLADYLARQ